MKQITDDAAIKSILVEGLDAFAQFCDEHGLHYILCGGTLLGAIRHKGFIPWDDDIDVAMPRGDYERFIDLTEGQMTERYAVQSYRTARDHTYPFVKIYDRKTVLIEDRYKPTSETGVFIDVFPIDGLPESVDTYRKRVASVGFYRKMNTYAGTSVIGSKTILRTLVRAILVMITKAIGTRFFNARINAIAQQTALETAKYCGVLVWGYGERERILSKDLLPRIKASFEGRDFYAPEGYDQYLRNLYGDYMTMPPEGKRVSHHDFKVFWKE